VALVRTDISEDSIASIIIVKRISELGTLAVTSSYWLLLPLIIFTLMMEEIPFSEKPVLTRATRRNIPKDGILQTEKSHSPKN
jgi:hypothetical protein